jgi:aminoglycoside phosphotransferase (APT) family kinase protein
MPPPPATGSRLDWHHLPQRVRDAVEAHLGSPVTLATTQPGGFSPGVAARLLLADGRRAFLKAVGPEPNPTSPAIHRREIAVASALPPTAPVPRLLWSYDEGEGGWVALLFEDIAGWQPAQPWDPAELDRVCAALANLSDALTPSPLPAGTVRRVDQGGFFGARWWSRLRDTPSDGLDPWSARHLDALIALEAGAPDAGRGETLLHHDLRADNILLTPERVVIVDWPHAQIGAPWIDLVCFAPSVAMQGGPDPETLLDRHPAARAAAPAAIDAIIAALAGYFTWSALQPPPPGLPTLRAFQDAQGIVARRWLAARTRRR